jgi:hypothetical protein
LFLTNVYGLGCVSECCLSKEKMFFEKKNYERKIIKSVSIFDTVHIERKIQAKYKDAGGK